METLELDVNRIIRQYHEFCQSIPLRPIHSEEDYDAAISALNKLLDAGGADENHPLAELVNALGVFIHDYEQNTGL